MNIWKKLKLEEETNEMDVNVIGEGGANGDIIPGQSLVFAILEVYLCMLVRQIPALSPSSNSIIIKSLRLSQSTKETDKLIAAALSCMDKLHKLCSPQGALIVIPTVLYLISGIVKEMATKSILDTTIKANNVSVQACLHCLKVLATDTYVQDEKYGKAWQKLLQTTLAKIIDLGKTGRYKWNS